MISYVIDWCARNRILVLTGTLLLVLAGIWSIQNIPLEAVPGVAEVASIGGFVRQYQVNVDPNKLRAYNIPLSMVIDRVRDSTNEVGGRVLEMAGARYMIRGL